MLPVIEIRRCFYRRDQRRAGARLKAELLRRSITPKMSITFGEFEILIDGIRLYSYKAEGKLPSGDELLDQVIEARSNLLRRELL